MEWVMNPVIYEKSGGWNAWVIPKHGSENLDTEFICLTILSVLGSSLSSQGGKMVATVPVIMFSSNSVQR